MTKGNAKQNYKKPDAVDCEIINLLQKNGRISNIDIAKKIGISEGTVRTRLNRLIKNEIIQIVAVSNPIKLGFKIVGQIRMQIDIGKKDNIVAKLKEIKALWFVVQTTGSTTGIEAEFIVKSLDDLNSLIFEQINKIDGVIKIDTSLILDFIKRRYDWGTALDTDKAMTD
jgi:Lrp/AsnC family transcriptional regulator, regulator for asnA, asnC and gidA